MILVVVSHQNCYFDTPFHSCIYTHTNTPAAPLIHSVERQDCSGNLPRARLYFFLSITDLYLSTFNSLCPLATSPPNHPLTFSAAPSKLRSSLESLVMGEEKERISGEVPRSPVKNEPMLPTSNPVAERPEPPKLTLHPAFYVMYVSTYSYRREMAFIQLASPFARWTV